MRATPKLSLWGTSILALKPCSLTLSQREPDKTPVIAVPAQLGSFGRGMLFHNCVIKGLIPRPRGSQAAVRLGPQLVPLFKLYWTPPKVRIPARMVAVGTALSMVITLSFQRKPW